MKIISVVGARPNFMKIAPFIKAINKYNANINISEEVIKHLLVHTGQHYDDRMSETFFKQLGIPEADINLGIGSGSHAEQVGKTMIEFEKVLRIEKPDWIVVVGDVNATLACSITAKKENIKCCHLEAGLRSGDQSMPEEINRIVTDRISDLLLTPDLISSDNLAKEGTPKHRISFVGNIMIDTLEDYRIKATSIKLQDIIIKDRLFFDKTLPEINDEEYALITLHRPSNVDDSEIFLTIIDFISKEIANDMVLIWPLHPRTRKQFECFDLFERIGRVDNIILLNPVSYLEMLRLNMGAKVLLTDSGGLQEESTVLGTPCLTLRWNTERPVTLRENGGASILVGNNIDKLRVEYLLCKEKKRDPFYPLLWDGNTAGRCLDAILNYKR